jgi:hypothetical protein
MGTCLLAERSIHGMRRQFRASFLLLVLTELRLALRRQLA